MRNVCFKKALVVEIIVLFLGVSVVSSMDNIAKDISADCSPLESVYNSEEKFSQNITWYEFIVGGFEGTGFYVFYPNATYQFRGWEGDDFFSGGTWTNDGRWFCCMHENGTLYEIDPKTLDACAIGDGGNGLNTLSYDPITNRMFGISGHYPQDDKLWKIDLDTGEQTEIGEIDLQYTIGIAFDAEGVLYGWDLVQDSLHIIDPDSLEVETVGSLGINLNYAQDGDFHKESDRLFLTAYTLSPQLGSFLYECDEDTGECQLLAQLQGEVSATAISYESTPPVTNISFDPPEPNGCNGWYISNVTVILNATDNTGVKVTYYRINGGDWEIYKSPFIITDDGDDILIEYYSVDIVGNVEDVKSATLDIDKTPPNMTVEWEVEKVGWRKWEVTFYIEIIDATSGSEGLEIYLNDVLQDTLPGSGPFTWGCIISSGLSFSFKFIAYDFAGNYAVVVVNDTDISYHNRNKYIFTQQSTNLLILRLLESFPLLERLWNLISYY